MEEKKKIKISLGMAILIVIIVLLLIALGIVYYFGFVKNNAKKLEAENMELNKQISSLKLEKEKLNNKISEIEKEDNKEENTSYYNDEDKYTTGNFQYYMNGYIKDIDDETRVFSLENPKISFEYPNSWAVSSYIEEENWEITVETPQVGVDMRILSYKRETENENIFVMLDPGSEVTQEGEIKVSNHDGYYKKYVFADARL